MLWVQNTVVYLHPHKQTHTMKTTTVTENYTVKSVEVVKSDFNSGVIDRRNIANGRFATYLLIRFDGGGYTKVRVGHYSHSNGGMCRMFMLDDANSDIAELVDENTAVHSSTWGATGTCTMMSMSNKIASKIVAGDVVKVTGRRAQTKFSWKITHAKIEVVK